MEAEELLKRLLEHFYVSRHGGLAWSYIEGTTIREVEGNDFELALLPYLRDKKATELREIHGALNPHQNNLRRKGASD